MGDWGGSPNKPYTTSDEVDTSKIMGEIGSNFNVDAAWGLGDNFYDDGVKNEYDKRFDETFESVFTASSLANIPFYIIAGNHDHHQNVTGEVMYSNHSKRWTYPDYWYNMKWTVPGSSIVLELLMIDTVTLSGMSDGWDYCESHGITKANCPIHPTGPTDILKAQSQWDWINQTMKASTADYLVVAGHYPIWSIAEHGSTADLVAKLNPLMKMYNATAYFSGHDHTFEYINTGDGIDYIDTGGTHVCDSSTAHTNTIPKNSLKFHGCNDGGFTRIRVDYSGLQTFYYYGKNSDVVYTVDKRKPRNV
eukprot:862577_1